MAMVASAVAHVAIFSYKPFSLILPNIKTLQKFEVSYYKIVSEPKKDDIQLNLKGEIKISKAQTKKEEKQEAKFYKAQSEQKITVKEVKQEAKKEQEKKVQVAKKVTLPETKSSTSQTKAYLDYYQILRQKIRREIVYPETDEGADVHLVFAISRDGNLKEILIDTAKSTKDPVFREAAVRGIKDAAPFPQFPAGLTQDVQSFNVIISFEPKE